MTKFWYQSSYDNLTLLFRKMYNSIYDYIQMLSMSKRKNCLSFLYKGKKKDGDKASILFKKMLCRMAKNTRRILERKENAIYKKKQTYKWRNESKLERWEKIKQRWLRFNIKKRTPKFRYTWICIRTPFSYGENIKKIFITRGGSSPCQS